LYIIQINHFTKLNLVNSNLYKINIFFDMLLYFLIQIFDQSNEQNSWW